MNHQKQMSGFPWRPAAALLFAAAVIAAGGVYFYADQRERIRRDKYEDLAAIAGLKSREISNWLRERMGDAEVLSKSPLLARNVARWLVDPNHPEAELHTRTRLEALLAYDAYQSIILTDLEGKARLVLGRGHWQILGSATREKLVAAARAGQASFSDFCLCDLCNEVHLDVFAPLRDGGRSTAVVILRIDPKKYLFPLIQSWPVPRKSAETLIVRREGNAALFLNELRHREGTAMRLSIPLSDTLVPATMAALGKEGLVEGRDYRGVPVLASIKKIPGSSWSMVAKVDKDEIYRPVRQMAVMVAASCLLLLLLATAAIGFAWQRRQRQFLKRLLETERQRQALVKRYEYLTKYANDCIFVLDENQRIIEANQRAVDAYGYTRDELLTMTAVQIRAEDQKAELAGQLHEAAEKGGSVFETRHRRKDGTVFPVEISVRPIEIEGRIYLQGIVRDISERKAAQEKLQASYQEIEANNQELHAAEEELKQKNEELQAAEEELQKQNEVLMASEEELKANEEELEQQLGEIQKSREELSISETRYRRLFESAKDGILILNADTGLIEDANPFIKELLGYPREELIGKELWEIGLFKDIVASRDSFMELKTRGYVRYEDLPLQTKDGLKREVEFVSNVYPVGDHNVVQCNIRDITKRKTAEKSLKENQERFRTFFENTFVGIYRTTPEGMILMANPALLAMLGYGSFEELAERNLEESGYQPGYDRGEFRRLMADGDQLIGHEAQWKRRDGSVVWVRENARLIRGAAGEVLYFEGTVEDISPQRRAEAGKTQAEDELRQAQKMEAIGQLAGGVAHDFNNMLAGILGNAEMLYSRLAESPELARMAEQIISGAEHAAKLTKQLLTFSRKERMQRAPVDVHRVIGETAGILANTIDRRISVEQHLRASPAAVLGDHSQLENALLNLGLNSRDAMPRGGRIIFSTETAELDAEYLGRHSYKIIPGKFVKIDVTDTGSGIPGELQAKIFEPFFTTKEPGKGTGLGLAAVYGAVKAHGGSIECYSEPGHGTTMTIYLPQLEAGAGEITEEVGEQKEAAPAGPAGKRILVVDDEELVRGMSEQVLKAHGYDVLTAGDGEEGVRVFQAGHREIDLVILDMIMPRMSGREAFLEMKKIHPEVRAILASGFSGDGEAREVLKLGIRGYVQKPFRVAQLLAAVGKALG